MKVYVAVASSEINRAEAVIAKLKAAGFEITCTWPENVRKVGHGNPADASQEQRAIWATTDLDEVRQADAFWFLLPSKGHSTSGAWVELGYAYARGMLIGMSGSSNSIFTGIGTMYATDEEALEDLIRVRDLPDEVDDFGPSKRKKKS